ncbi:hypothetical protein FHQ08_01480 [Lactobacillus sp. CC-MHH1034]|uniref:hypothetical protein n=1 Tax=Agrilactobacillus fermenti TaxID=2586909 RepID=UPI001E5334AD|nr:hypothetical protein [Agrilactobacillus fermenti]MCD2255381.1 hypothetical protein [Agrilactobacillus fermenti]
MKTNGILFSSAINDYIAQRPDIQVQFSNRPLAPSGYQQILELIAKKQLQPFIDRILPYTEIQTSRDCQEKRPGAR